MARDVSPTASALLALEVIQNDPGMTPPQELDALRVLEEHLSQGWTHPDDVLVDATVE